MITTRARLWFGALALLAAAAPARGQEVAGVNVVELFLSLDANNDSAVERGEVPEKGRDAFDRLLKLGDTNKDGRLDREEYRAVLERARESARSAAEARFKANDKDGDGKLSADEFPGPRPLFRRLDANGDGFLTLEEARALRPGAAGLPGAGGNLGGAMAARLKAMDKDGDGVITRDEFTGPPALFDRLDRDGDGKVRPGDLPPGRPAGPAGKARVGPKAEGGKARTMGNEKG